MGPSEDRSRSSSARCNPGIFAWEQHPRRRISDIRTAGTPDKYHINNYSIVNARKTLVRHLKEISHITVNDATRRTPLALVWMTIGRSLTDAPL